MDVITKIDFESYPNVRVLTAKDFLPHETMVEKSYFGQALNNFLRVNACDHLFIDEMIIGENVFTDPIKTFVLT